MADTQDDNNSYIPISEVGSESQKYIEGEITGNQQPRKNTTDMEVFMRVMRELLNDGVQPRTPTVLVKYDPDEPDTDIESWCKITEIIINHKNLKGTDLLLSLTQALRGRAATCITKICPNAITWENIKEHLIAKFSKPLAIQDYFERVISFKINEKESAAEAAMRLWHLIESIPNIDMQDDIIIGFAIAVLSRIDSNIRKELNFNNITNKSQMCRILRGVSLKRQAENSSTNIDNKRIRFANNRNFYSNGNCYSCGEIGHRALSCNKNRSEGLQVVKSRPNERRIVVCYVCGSPEHLANVCPGRKASIKQIKLCDKRAVTGELLVAGILTHFLFDSGSECSLMKREFSNKVNGIKFFDFVSLLGLGNTNVRCSEQIQCDTTIQGVRHDILFHIVDDIYLVEPIILGRDIIDLGVQIEINSKGITILKTKFSQMCTNNSCIIESQIDTDLVDVSRKHLYAIINYFASSFVEGTPTIRTKTISMKIDLIDSFKTVQRRPYRLAAIERDIVNKQILELLNSGVIRESNSPFASPILLIKKKDGGHRMVVDYRELNANTRADNYPLPRINDQIDRLHGVNYFSSLDMTSAFHCIRMEPDSVERTAFVTPDGQFEYLAMPFGLKNAPSVFQRAIQTALKGCSYALVYIDDVLIPSLTVEEGLERLQEVLEALTSAGFSLNIKKCKFLKLEVKYLGYIIKAGEIRPNPNKIEALVNIPAPQNVTQVRQFIGLASYFRQFILNFSILMAPLYSLLQHKGNVKWTEEHKSIHEHVVSVLTSEPVLAIFDPDKDIELHTDASSLGYGAILIQRSNKVPHVIAYFSRRTSEAESRYHSYELETLAVVRAVENFRHYLYGRHFTIRTDCNALKSSSSKRDLTPRVHRWWAILQGYDFNIEYKEGRYISHADFLSRNPLPHLDVTESSIDRFKEKIVNVVDLQQEWIAVEQQRDNEINDILMKWQVGDLHSDLAQTYDVRKGVLYRKVQRHKQTLWLPIVPKSLAWSLISHVHTEIKHLGYEKTLNKLYDSYWFPGMCKAVKRFVDACVVCKALKSSSGVSQVSLHPIPKVSCPWHTVHFDISGKLSGKSQRKEYVSVIIDAFTKFVLLRHTTALDANCAIESLKQVLHLFGVPKRVITDQGRCFVSTEFKKFCSENNIKLHFIAVGASRANGQVERVMQTLKNLLTVVENSTDNPWRDELGEIQLVMNSTRCRVTGYTPIELMFGTKALTPGLSKISCDSDINRSNIEEIRENASKNIDSVANYDKVRFNKTKAVVRSFNQGDFVFLKCCERNQRKLDRKFRGPFKIVNVLENDRYELQHVDGSKRIYKYPHESLREVPKGRAGLTESAEALCEQALNEDTVSENSVTGSDKIEDSDNVSVYKICYENDDDNISEFSGSAGSKDDDICIDVGN